jgi:hypothetical protein
MKTQVTKITFSRFLRVVYFVLRQDYGYGQGYFRGNVHEHCTADEATLSVDFTVRIKVDEATTCCEYNTFKR